MFTCMIILANIFTMAQEIRHPEESEDFIVVNHFYMLFYVFELSLKAYAPMFFSNLYPTLN